MFSRSAERFGAAVKSRGALSIHEGVTTWCPPHASTKPELGWSLKQGDVGGLTTGASPGESCSSVGHVFGIGEGIRMTPSLSSTRYTETASARARPRTT